MDIINWVRNYLSNRGQKCTINGLTSNHSSIHCGVPQGSILGPLLFLLYVNDVSTNMLHSNILLYANDTVIFAKHDDKKTSHLLVSSHLEMLYKWCNTNQLTINLTKTKLMLFGTRNMMKQSSKLDISLSDKLQYVKHYYLGIKLEDTLTFELRAAETMRMVSHKIYLLSRIRKYITTGQSIAIH